MGNVKKYLDLQGLEYILSLLDNYPDNEILTAVIAAIQEILEEKANKEDLTALEKRITILENK